MKIVYNENKSIRCNHDLTIYSSGRVFLVWYHDAEAISRAQVILARHGTVIDTAQDGEIVYQLWQADNGFWFSNGWYNTRELYPAVESPL